jgi:hypothetical protein
VALALLLPACGTVHLSNGSVGACYQAIPAAKAAVHDPSAHLVGVRRLPIDDAEAALRAAARRAGDDDTTVCAVVLRGPFAPGQVTLAPPGQRGTYAVILLSGSHPTELAASVSDHVPSGFGRRLA